MCAGRSQPDVGMRRRQAGVRRPLMFSLLLHGIGLGVAALVGGSPDPLAGSSRVLLEAQLRVEHDAGLEITRAAPRTWPEARAPVREDAFAHLEHASPPPRVLADEWFAGEVAAAERESAVADSRALDLLAPSHAAVRQALALRRRSRASLEATPPPVGSAAWPAAQRPGALAGAAAERRSRTAALRVLFAPDARHYYPIEARRQQVQGTVHVRITIDARGLVVRALVARGSGSDVLDAAAIALAWNYRFSRGSGPRHRLLPIVFRLDPLASPRRHP